VDTALSLCGGRLRGLGGFRFGDAPCGSSSPIARWVSCSASRYRGSRGTVSREKIVKGAYAASGTPRALARAKLSSAAGPLAEGEPARFLALGLHPRSVRLWLTTAVEEAPA
jgi:hypothetical protein